MDLKQEHGKPKNRFLKLSLKKNRMKADYETKELNRSFDIMIIDESFDRLISEHQKTVSLKPKIYSTIVIDDSFNTTNEDDIMMNKEPSKYGNVSTSSIRDLTSPSNNNDNRPSRGGWSPGQNILCATPRTKPAPATPKDVANESFEKCSIKTIQKSHHKLLNDLYGESWQSIPSLFKSIQRRRESHNEISKKLQFEDDESDKENIGQASEKHTELFLTESDLKNKTGIFSDIETKSKKTLYTEKVPIIQEPPEQKPLKGRKKVVKTTSTPELPKQKSIKYNRDVKTTGKKRKDMTVRELVNTLLNDVDRITEKVQSVTPKTQQRCESRNEISKKLQFEDFDSDKNENIRQVMKKNKELYLTGSDLKNKKGNFGDIERKSKKKLYTEKIPNTPEPPQQKPLRSYRDVKATSTPELPKHNSTKHNRDVKTTGKKCKVKSVTELVKTLQDDVDGLTKRVQSVRVSPKTGDVVKRLGFIGSLADNVPSWRCHPEALQYHDQYKTLKEQLARRLYVEFNKVVFDDRLEADMCITWDAKLRSTAGMTINRSIKTSRGDKLRTSSIKLSVKVLDTAQRLRDTLIHEMCHAATWLIDAQLRAGHGPLWKKWTLKALRHFPELGEIARCHDLAIHYKYCYKCTQCGYSIKRHSKSIDITKKCCGCCRGKFEILINKKNKDGVVVSTPVRQAGPSGFALYVKEHYGALKSGRSHGEVMRMLGEQYSAKKPQNMERIGSDDSVDDLCSD